MYLASTRRGLRLNPRWLIVLSVIGILAGVGFFLDGFIFYVWGCFGPACSGGPPFSYYLYVWFIPMAIIGVSSALLAIGLKLRAVQIRASGIPS